jgi:teichuronic acid biosynthesis glycosyltransferase TuaG
MENNQPLVSVVISTYNIEKYIESTLLSVINQTYQNLEILIIDDSSTDSTLKIIERLAASDDRIKYIKINHTGEPAIPRNIGIREAAGEFIAFLDHDDIWVKNKLEQQIKYFKKFPDAVFIYSASVSFGDVNIFSPLYEVLPLIFRAAKSKDDLIKIGNTITCSSVIVKAKYLKMTGGFDEDPKLRGIDDYDLWIRLSEQGNFYFVPRIHVKYRIHSFQASGSWEKRNTRLKNLAAKRSLNLPMYKMHRHKPILKFVRSLLHYANYVLYNILTIKKQI